MYKNTTNSERVANEAKMYSAVILGQEIEEGEYIEGETEDGGWGTGERDA